MLNINDKKFNYRSALTIVSVLTFSTFFSTHSLAKLNFVGKIHTQEGYPYADLIRRSEQMNLIYTKSENKVTCRVEVSNNGQVWQGPEHVTKLKNFKNKPLYSCLARPAARKLLASTY
jgi:hypothetical protein